MSDVQFNEPQYQASEKSRSHKDSLMTRIVIGAGLAKDEAGAQKVLAGVAAVIVLVAVVVYFVYAR